MVSIGEELALQPRPSVIVFDGNETLSDMAPLARRFADRLLSKAGVRGELEQLLSVDDAGAWKPARCAYAYAARTCSAGLEQMLLVAVHPWDIHGAHQAGMLTGWITRQGSPYPDYFAAPGLQAPDLVALAGQIVS